ncbi:uncharacterized protein N7483_002458 [Penicillium malachiteum]|uniref:uncharacterized protein n=1 Tax=Penicillium malachiteum TaxID=1324776 RepID=UPI0025495B1D|nr:uncharacterized protein N7483_002458 [Penicillium malachiteum]KAJ5737333.1 hypothetical protein N7483_002458 [Penicillium malachiteum]
MPPLYRAVSHQRLDIAERLILQHGASVDSEYGGKSTLLLAIELRYPQAVALLLKHKAHVGYCCDFRGRGLLSVATAYDTTVAIVRQLLQQTDIDVNDRCSAGMTAVMYAIEHRQYAILQLLLLDPRVELNVENNVGQTPLHFAISKEDYLSVQILVQN